MIHVKQAHFPVIALTHAGMSGKNNEDQFAVSAYRFGPDNRQPAMLAVLSDGIGGHRGGEVASEIAVNTISQKVSNSDGTQPVDLLRDAFVSASAEIYRQAEASPERKGMGATCACALILGQRLYTATIGDSRIYLIRGGAIRQISIDHTWIREMLDAGVITPKEAEGHPNAHVIRRYLGSPNPPQVDFRLHLSDEENDEKSEANQGLLLQPGDRLLLCSDGLTDLVKDNEILAALCEKDMYGAGSGLIDLANQRGGHDNITLISIRVPERRSTASFFRALPWKKLALGCAGLVVLALLAIGIVFGGIWLSGKNEPTPSRPAPTGFVSSAAPKTSASDTGKGLPTTSGKTVQASSAPTQPSSPANTPTLTLRPLPSGTPTLTLQPSDTPGPSPTPWPTNTINPTP